MAATTPTMENPKKKPGLVSRILMLLVLAVWVAAVVFTVSYVIGQRQVSNFASQSERLDYYNQLAADLEANTQLPAGWAISNVSIVEGSYSGFDINYHLTNNSNTAAETFSFYAVLRNRGGSQVASGSNYMDYIGQDITLLNDIHIREELKKGFTLELNNFKVTSAKESTWREALEIVEPLARHGALDDSATVECVLENTLEESAALTIYVSGFNSEGIQVKQESVRLDNLMPGERYRLTVRPDRYGTEEERSVRWELSYAKLTTSEWSKPSYNNGAKLVEVVDMGFSKDNYGNINYSTTKLEGQLRNVSGESIRSVYLIFGLYDKDGVKIDSPSTYISNFKAGETTDFSLYLYRAAIDENTTWKLEGIHVS